MYIVFVVIAIILAAVGALFLTQVTSGVGVIALACLAGIIERIVQAAAYNRD